jgi:hypothetical protein
MPKKRIGNLWAILNTYIRYTGIFEIVVERGKGRDIESPHYYVKVLVCLSTLAVYLSIVGFCLNAKM